MTLGDLIDVSLQRDGVKWTGVEDTESVVTRVTSCVSTAITTFVTQITNGDGSVGFEADVTGVLDRESGEVEVEVVLGLRHAGSPRATIVAMALLQQGFRYLAGPNHYHMVMGIGRRGEA